MRNLITTAPWVAVLLLLAAPIATATNYAAGTAVTKYDYDYFPKPGSVTSSLCFFDADASGTHNSFEAIIIDVDSATCGTNVEMDDIRLTAHDTYKPFSAVKQEDSDWNDAVTIFADVTLMYFDADVNGKLGDKDTLYLDIKGVGGLVVQVGDLRITAFREHPAGSFVRGGDKDIAFGVNAFGAFTDANVVYKAGSAYYINADKGTLGTSDVGVEDGDIRILAKAPDPLAWNSSDITVTSLTTSPATLTTASPFQVVVALKNGGKEPAARFLETNWAGTLVDARSSPVLPPSASATIVITLPAPTSTGTKALSVAGNSTNVTVDPGADVNSLKVAALEHDLETLKAQLLAHGIDLEAEAEPATGALQVQENSVEKAPGVDLAVLAIALGMVVFMSRRRKA